MNRFFEYIVHHPFLVAAAAILAVLAIVIEFRHRARGSSAVAPSGRGASRQRRRAAARRARQPRTTRPATSSTRGSLPAAELAAKAETLKKYKEKPVIVYCDSGAASGAAARTLRAAGFNKVVTLRGGLQSWRQENLPLVKGAARKDGKQCMSGAPEVVMYSTNWCGYCQRARNLLERKGVAVREIKLDDEPQQRRGDAAADRRPAHRAADLHRRAARRGL